MKYKLTEETKTIGSATLYRIQATKSFGFVEKGDFGGWIEKESNLSQRGKAWVDGSACVYGNAHVHGNASVSGNVRVYGDAYVYGDARVSGNSHVYGDAWVSGNALVCDSAHVYGNALVYGNIHITKTSDYLNIPNLKYNLTITKDYVLGGCREFTHEEFRNLTLETCKDKTWTQKELDGYKLGLVMWESRQ